MGTLGAVDPFLVKQITRNQHGDAQADVSEVTEIFNSMPQVFSSDANDDGMRQIRDVTSKKNTKDEQNDERQVSQKPKTRSLITVEELNLSKEHKYSAMAIF
jgi:hypothetical protein